MYNTAITAEGIFLFTLRTARARAHKCVADVRGKRCKYPLLSDKNRRWEEVYDKKSQNQICVRYKITRATWK